MSTLLGWLLMVGRSWSSPTTNIALMRWFKIEWPRQLTRGLTRHDYHSWYLGKTTPEMRRLRTLFHPGTDAYEVADKCVRIDEAVIRWFARERCGSAGEACRCLLAGRPER